MVKKKSSRNTRTKHISVSPTHFMIKRSIVSYAVLVFLFFVMATMSWYLIDRMVASQGNQARLDRISSIYTSLSLGDSYRMAKADIFGDKRVYEWDSGRTYSSSAEYGHDDTVNNTFADLKNRIESAGFSHFETEYADSAAQQYHFRNNNGEYVRVGVVNSAMHDIALYGTPIESSDIHNNDVAPSYVTIKVNLDDNNE